MERKSKGKLMPTSFMDIKQLGGDIHFAKLSAEK
jgi:hypothetical protein